MDMGNPSDLKEDNNEMDNVDKNNEDMDNCEDNDGMDLEELAFWLPPDDQDHEDIHSDCKYKRAAWFFLVVCKSVNA
jgi:hypothetical protein